MTCAITVTDYFSNGLPVVGQKVTTYPVSPYLQVKIGGVFVAYDPPYAYGTTDSGGNATITLYWPSETTPATMLWTIALPSGVRYTGTIPEGVTSVTLTTLIATYGWLPANDMETPIYVPGPAGVSGSTAVIQQQPVFPGYTGGTATVTTTFNSNGTITETYSNGLTVTTTFNSDGSITQAFTGLFTQTKTTTFSGSTITETVT